VFRVLVTRGSNWTDYPHDLLLADLPGFAMLPKMVCLMHWLSVLFELKGLILRQDERRYCLIGMDN
jgi:ABC-type uncharacterized transport system permease subunit